MARRTAGTQASHPAAQAAESDLHATDRDGVLTFDGDPAEFTDDTVISATEEVFALLGSISLGGQGSGLEASLGWNFFTFG
jgi:hypothetical protein